MACDLGPISNIQGQHIQILFTYSEASGPSRPAFVLRENGTCSIDPDLLRQFAKGSTTSGDITTVYARALLAASVGEFYPMTEDDKNGFKNLDDFSKNESPNAIKP